VVSAVRRRSTVARDAILDGRAPENDPERVARRKLGGSKGGKLRAEKLSRERRAEIAGNAASARWANPG
jgi:hypothetical protein